MKLRAKDTVHISAVQADNLVEGDEFEIDDAFGESLIKRGIADLVVEAPAEKPEGKKAPEAAPKPARSPRKKA